MKLAGFNCGSYSARKPAISVPGGEVKAGRRARERGRQARTMQSTCRPQLQTSLLLGPPTAAHNDNVQFSGRHDSVEYIAFRRFGIGRAMFQNVPKF